MANQETLDEIDIKILKLLQQNSHMTVKETCCTCASVTVANLRASETSGARGLYKKIFGCGGSSQDGA